MVAYGARFAFSECFAFLDSWKLQCIPAKVFIGVVFFIVMGLGISPVTCERKHT